MLVLEGRGVLGLMLEESLPSVPDGDLESSEFFEGVAAGGAAEADAMVGVPVGCDVVALHRIALRRDLLLPLTPGRSEAELGGETNHAGE